MGEAVGPPRLVLASASASRRDLLTAAGVEFAVVPSRVDEAATRAQMTVNDSRHPPPLGHPRLVARTLARAKAFEVSGREPKALVIGADQTLALLVGNDGQIGQEMHKPAGRVEARAQLREMRGRTHVLCAAVALAREGAIVWETEDMARLTMRTFSDAFLDHYLAHAGERVCSSVGAYQLEGLGIQLFERIEGDYFTILGLPLLPLLVELRRQGVLAS